MRIIDLTQTLEAGIRGFSSEQAMTISENGWNATTLNIYSHAGTHIDAACHFLAGREGIDSVPVADFVADCYIVDLPGTAPKSLLTPGCLGTIAEKVRPGNGLLFRTGWSRYIADKTIYRDSLPRISDELAEWMINRKVKIAGVEAPSVADVNNIREVTHIHSLLLSAGVVIVEGLINLDLINSEKVRFIALPLKIKDCDGAPCRAIAIEED
jgi:kynurenine formamidase